MPNSINVLRVVIGLNLGGVQQGVLNLFQHLDPERYRPIACAIENDGAIGREIAQAGFEVINLGLKGRRAWPQIIKQLGRIMREKHIHILHASTYHPALYGRIAALLVGVPIIIAHEHVVFRHYRFKRAILSQLLGRFTDLHIAVCQAVREQVIDWHQLSPARVRVVYNGVNPSYLLSRRPQAEIRRKLHLKPDNQVVGVISRLDPEKGHRYLFAALQTLRQRYPLECLVVGAGRGEDRVKQQAKDYEVADITHFLGLRRDIPDILAAIDIFVLPSDQEGLSNAVLEAMAAGVPVIVSDADGNVEAVQHGVHGLVFPRGDIKALAECIQELVDRPAYARQLAQTGQERISREFTVARYGQQIQALYDQLIREKIDSRW
ncbi:MAG: glycosyltransferase [Deltaproteobacteria bacterium]|nr:glycosyltransferase [Deltaproteobacteria bacterium]MBW1953509.1 glycosyltransferase [Deltaproteobacteria bacterium]MBW1987206.1 glycosyltransferase [Deltaproteobacteria bacterium]MBW2134314.1 glycosyltransferase [Deltaproteobacteria bacterium]